MRDPKRYPFIRAAALLLALCLAFGLAACGKKEEEIPPVYASAKDVTAETLARDNSWEALLQTQGSAGLLRSIRSENGEEAEMLELHAVRNEDGWEINQYTVAANGTAAMFYRNTADELKASYVVAPGESYLYLYSDAVYSSLQSGGVLYRPEGAKIAVSGAEEAEDGTFIIQTGCFAENGDLLANSSYVVDPKSGRILSAKHRATEEGRTVLYEDTVSAPDNWEINAEPKTQITACDEPELCEVQLTIAGQAQTLKLRRGTRIVYDYEYVGVVTDGAAFAVE